MYSRRSYAVKILKSDIFRKQLFKRSSSCVLHGISYLHSGLSLGYGLDDSEGEEAVENDFEEDFCPCGKKKDFEENEGKFLIVLLTLISKQEMKV